MYPLRTPFAERDSGRLRYSPATQLDHASRQRTYTPSPSRTKGVSLRFRLITHIRRYYGLIALVIIALLVWTSFNHDDRQLDQVVDRVKRNLVRSSDRERSFAARRRHISWPGWKGIEQVFAFGDSHTDTGFKPGGVQPNHFNPLGNPYWPGRTGNYGPNYLGHLTATFNQSFVKTYNLAKKDSVVFRRDGTDSKAPTLEHQVEDIFVERYGRSHVKSHLHKGSGWGQDNTLFVFHAGTDDIVTEWVNRVGEEPADRNMTLVDMFFAEYQSNLNRIYDYGARNFIIVGFPALEESPRLRLCGKEKSMMRFGAELTDMNGRLVFMAHMFAEAHLDATVFFFDNYRLGINIRSSPKDFEETKEINRLEGFCYPYAISRDVIDTDNELCGAPLRHFYWRDEQHQTEGYHRAQARLMREEMADIRNALPYEFY